jgi:hypothetical protein
MRMTRPNRGIGMVGLFVTAIVVALLIMLFIVVALR